MPTEGQILFRSREEIVDSLISGLLSRVPDAYVGEDGNLVLIFNVIGDVHESIFIAIQIVTDDMFVMTASAQALDRHGSELQEARASGTPAVGELLFSGTGGTVIGANTEAAYDPGAGNEVLYFNTTSSVTIPTPGVPTAPTLADAGAGALAAGTYEYGVTFHTDEGETALGVVSAPPLKRL